jgi:hypothetical protein
MPQPLPLLGAPSLPPPPGLPLPPASSLSHCVASVPRRYHRAPPLRLRATTSQPRLHCTVVHTSTDAPGRSTRARGRSGRRQPGPICHASARSPDRRGRVSTPREHPAPSPLVSTLKAHPFMCLFSILSARSSSRCSVTVVADAQRSKPPSCPAPLLREHAGVA